MVDQTTTNGSRATPASMTRNVSNFACDFVTLAELQGKLFASDFQESKRRLLWPLAMLLAGAVMLLAAFPVALSGLALILERAGLPLAGAYFASAGIAALLAGALLYAGWKLLGSAIQVYRRSTQELERNVQWLKMVLTSR